MDYLTLLEWIFYALVLGSLLYLYLMWPYLTSRITLPGPKPLPLLGNISFSALKDKPLGELDLENYRKYGKVYRMFEGRTSIINIHDSELIREVFVKQFSKFSERRTMQFRGIMRNSLFDMHGAEWKRVRNILTPLFSGGKIKQMTSLINSCADTLIQNLKAKCRTKDDSFDAFETASCFTMDAIASTGFGLATDAQSNPEDPFIVNAKKVSTIDLKNPLIIIMIAFPALARILDKLFGFVMFPPSLIEFFTHATNVAIEGRVAAKVKSADFIQLMIKSNQEAQDYENEKSSSPVGATLSRKGLTKDEIIAQAILFFLAGNDTTATALTWLLYSLAANQDCQKRLADEVLKVLPTKNHLPDYDSIAEMTYLDMCVNEALRKYPPVFKFEREAGEDVEINGVFIPKGALVMLPVWAIHNDPEVWPNPEKFDPERFSAEQKESRDPCSFLTFGYGPRNCIGMRLALLELKIVTVRLIQNFNISINSKTQMPVGVKKAALFGHPQHPIWLSLEEK